LIGQGRAAQVRRRIKEGRTAQARRRIKEGRKKVTIMLASACGPRIVAISTDQEEPEPKRE
jgi:hypothetical protein